MYKLVSIFVFLVLFGAHSDRVAGQAPDKGQVLPALKAHNAEAKYLYSEGMKLTEAGQFSKAVETLEQAVRLEPEYADAYTALGRAYFKMRQWQKAVVNLRRAAELNSKQRASQEALARKALMPESKGANRQLTGAPASPQTKQEVNANASAVRPRSAESRATQPREQQKETRTAVKSAHPSSQTKLPQAANGTAADVKPLLPESGTLRPSEPRAEVSTPAKPTSTSEQIKPPQETNAGVKPLRPESEGTQQRSLREETKTGVKAAPASPQTNLPQELSANAAGANPPSPESEIPREPEQRKEANASVRPATTSPQIELPQETDAGVKQLRPESEATQPREQQGETNGAVKAAPSSPQTNLPPELSANAADANSLSPKSEITREPEQRKEANASVRSATTSPQIELPKETKTGVKPLEPEAEATRQREQVDEAGTSAQAIPPSQQIKLPQENNGTGAGLKPPSPESAPTQQPEQTADGMPALNSKIDSASEEQEPVSVRVAMSVKPASTSAEPKSVSPFSPKPANEEVSLTRIYRVGPSDVLDVRINDSQPTQSTLFTVTPSGLLEHPMLAEPLLVTGLTVDEIGKKIGNDLKQRALIDDPKVVVGVRDYASHSILVSGLVKDSGTKFLRREAIPLYVVVADAQPLPQATRVTVVRNELNQIYDIDLTQVAEMNLLVRPGDVITLHPNVTQFFYIGGEVKFPGEKTYRRGLTLMQAILTAGGVSPKSKVAEIGRDDGQGFLVGTHFNLKEIQAGKAVDPLLKPGDRITILR